jgi:hypothetical protein
VWDLLGLEEQGIADQRQQQAREKEAGAMMIEI